MSEHCGILDDKTICWEECRGGSPGLQSFRGKSKDSIRVVCYFQLRFCGSGLLGLENSLVMNKIQKALKQKLCWNTRWWSAEAKKLAVMKTRPATRKCNLLGSIF